jgi:hypothetical protein
MPAEENNITLGQPKQHAPFKLCSVKSTVTLANKNGVE